ncbi:ribosome maturation factor RimM [Anianabacter salinae]|uniref:ribosome maturation factor RimM n=1 Tax=Anianabacter salinae TaxID=2851023 RepID=UPI00225DF717|nr:ribosome maturation factor RimM [Anianabacter salinae]MBV0910959.1 ribosome maturation factor RimM [Anianabacter salinae]
MTDRVCVGAIAGAFGVRGEVRLKSFCADPEAIAAYGPLWTEAQDRRFEVSITGVIPQGLSANLTGVATKEQADALRGLRLYADRDALPPAEDDEFYFADLIGLAVMDTGGARLGTIKAVLENPGNDLLEVSLDGHGKTALLPFTQAVVPTVDLEAALVVIDPPEGLLPD